MRSRAPSNPLRVAIVDDHELLRIGVGRAIAAVPGWEVVASVGTADELLAKLPEQLDVAVLDFSMPGVVSGFDAVSAFVERGVEVVVLTALEPESIGEECRARGAVAVVGKVDGPGRLRDTIAEHMGHDDAVPRLTPRERQVVEALQEGLQNQQIAGRLGISVSAVKRHLEHIMEKTGVRTRNGLAALPLDSM